MKSAGLSSKSKKVLRELTKMTASSNLQQNHLVAKEKQKALRQQAAHFQFERQKKETKASAEGVAASKGE